ncbi:MFS transporter [Kribbella deserti]|uniref:MFS transporter n=1 Tax=Kribbella deserti TaxID=1926257 RepID=A0ABV6QE16_9ACTN
MTTRATGTVHPTDDHSHHHATSSASRPVRRETFTSLRIRNFRLFAAGLFVSSAGGWVQRIAQDWLVLTLTGSATAVGITTALQFLPTIFLGLFGGLIADRFPKRRILLVTQSSMGALAAILAMLALTGRVEVWHVYLLALGLGIATSVDNPSRQAFVNEMVGRENVRNAISMVSSTFQLGALIGPAIGGAMIGAVGTGWAFAVNAATYLGSITALALIRENELRGRTPRRTGVSVRLRDGLTFVRSEPAVLWPVVLVGIFGFFTMSLPVTLAAFADSVFHSGAAGYGLLNSVVALGALAGALISARRRHAPRLRNLVTVAAALTVTEVVAAFAPSQWAFLPLLVALGLATLMFLNVAQSMVQLTTPDAMRGRVMGVYMLVFIGGGALGGPAVGWIAEHAGPRVSLLLAGLIPAAATLLIAVKLARSSRLRLVLRPVATRSPWRQPPLRLTLEPSTIKLNQPAFSPRPSAPVSRTAVTPDRCRHADRPGVTTTARGRLPQRKRTTPR